MNSSEFLTPHSPILAFAFYKNHQRKYITTRIIKRMLTKFILTISPRVKLIAYSSTVVGVNPISKLSSKSVFTAPSDKKEPMISPTSPPTTAANIKAIIKNVISRPFKPSLPRLIQNKIELPAPGGSLQTLSFPSDRSSLFKKVGYGSKYIFPVFRSQDLL